jgi:recombination protein RecA
MVARVKTKPSGGGAYFGTPNRKVAMFSSGSKLLDLALGGGWAEDRVANVIGDKSTGKTLLCIEACANFERKYGKGAELHYREVESAFDKPYAAALGMPVKIVNFGNGQLQTVEDMFDDLNDICKKRPKEQKKLYIVDSLDALSDVAEMGRDMDEGTYGTDKARKLSMMFRKSVRQWADHHITVLVVSQIRSKIGAMAFQKTTTRTGGRAMDFYCSQVLELTQIARLTRTVSGIKRVTGIRVKGKVEKNKVGLPFREAEFKIVFGYGIDDIEACVGWLEEARSLDRINQTKASVASYLRMFDKTSDERYREELKDLHAAVTDRWYEVERSFLPTRRKYS